MGRSKKTKSRDRQQHALVAVPLTVASPEIGAPTLTVGQLVEQLGPLVVDTAAMSERIRHWTREGLLVPADQHHAGTGRHRRYDVEAAYEAAILNALATAGLQLVSRPYIRAALNQSKAALQKWQQAAVRGRKLPLFLVILHPVGRTGANPTVSIHERIALHDLSAETMVVVNLSQLFLQVWKTRSEYLDNDQNARSEQR